jgi:hypothetical protein
MYELGEKVFFGKCSLLLFVIGEQYKELTTIGKPADLKGVFFRIMYVGCTL